MQPRHRTVATKAKAGASRGKVGGKVPGKVGKKPTLVDNMGDMLAEQLLAIQATNADILQRIQHLEARGDPPRPVQLGPGVGEEDRRLHSPPRPVQLGPGVGEDDWRPQIPPRSDQLGPVVDRRLGEQPERRVYSPSSPGRVATLPEVPQIQEFDQTVQNFIKQLEAEGNAQFHVEGDKFEPQKRAVNFGSEVKSVAKNLFYGLMIYVTSAQTVSRLR